MPLQNVLLNLVTNAIKHNDREDGKVQVSVEERDDHYVFAVVDNGPGIAAKYHDDVFRMFKTLRPRDQVEGSGMGLAMVQKTVTMIGGTITLASEEGKGCRFSFTWPKLHQTAEDEAA
jgi:signal transduction histidine kinase